MNKIESFLSITFRTSSVSDMNLSKAKLVNCVRDMDAWMLSNKLKLNKDKSDVLVISSSYRPRPLLSSVDICNEADCILLPQCTQYWSHL